MNRPTTVSAILSLLLPACAAPDAPPAALLAAAAAGPSPASASGPPRASAPQGSGYFDPYSPSSRPTLATWSEGQALTHGYLGVNGVTDFERTGGGTPPVEAEGGSIDQYPVIGGGAQFKLGGDRLSWGLEGLLSLGGRANGGAFVIGGGGAVIAVSLDLFVVDVYGGPFLSVPLGDRARLYGGVGPVLQFASYHQSATELTEPGSGNGFGVGGYARTGVEFELAPGSLVGLGARWYDTSVDLGGGLGDLDLQGVEAFVSVGVIY